MCPIYAMDIHCLLFTDIFMCFHVLTIFSFLLLIFAGNQLRCGDFVDQIALG